MTRPRLPATRSGPRRRIRRALCVLAACSLVSTGCAGIMNGRTQLEASLPTRRGRRCSSATNRSA